MLYVPQTLNLPRGAVPPCVGERGCLMASRQCTALTKGQCGKLIMPGVVIRQETEQSPPARLMIEVVTMVTTCGVSLGMVFAQAQDEAEGVVQGVHGISGVRCTCGSPVSTNN